MRKGSLLHVIYLSLEEAWWCVVKKKTSCCTQLMLNIKEYLKLQKGDLVEPTWCTSNNYSIVCQQLKLYEDCEKPCLSHSHQTYQNALPLHKRKKFSMKK
jgi:hypothetical protein